MNRTQQAPNQAAAQEHLRQARQLIIQAVWDGSRDNSAAVLAFNGERQWSGEQLRALKDAEEAINLALLATYPESLECPYCAQMVAVSGAFSRMAAHQGRQYQQCPGGGQTESDRRERR